MKDTAKGKEYSDHGVSVEFYAALQVGRLLTEHYV